MTVSGEGFGPGGEQERELAGIFVIAGHLDGSSGAQEFSAGDLSVIYLFDIDGLLFGRSRFSGAGVFEQFELRAGDVECAKAG